MIPYGRQNISDDDVRAVVEVLRSDWLTQGPAVPRFESAIASYCGADHVVAVSNATAALHIACLALDLGPGDILWTSPNTFVASANCARYCGASVDFVDIDPQHFNMSIPALRDKLEKAERDGQLPKIVVPVHFAGQSCDMREIGLLSKRYGFRVIEDASHAIGGEYLGDKVGNCRYSDITVFSFHPVKIITSGEGGTAVTNDAQLAERMRLLRSHGITRDPAQMNSAPEGAWDYQQIALGYNYRMTDIQAALGASQMARIDSFIFQRRRIADHYDMALDDMPVGRISRNADAESAWHLYVICVDELRARKTRKAVFDALREADILANVHYTPVHLQPYYRQLGFREGDFPEAERYSAQTITLPIYPALSSDDLAFVASTLHDILKA
jgi:UDP-4-amino-4,6-dideoxy-N-acetyl-beta-L-altrosamine transaminase